MIAIDRLQSEAKEIVYLLIFIAAFIGVPGVISALVGNWISSHYGWPTGSVGFGLARIGPMFAWMLVVRFAVLPRIFANSVNP